jgi:septum formation protein
MDNTAIGGSNRTISPALVLASSSPRRKELLAGLGLTFTIDPSDADESFLPGTPPEEVVRMLALRKAESVAARYKEGLVIGSDTIVVLGDTILGKPSDDADACRMLAMLQGRAHAVYSGVAIVDAESKRSIAEVSKTLVIMRPLTDEQIAAYVRTGEPRDKAGSYGIQGLGSIFIEKIDGDFYTIVGLPLNLLYQMLLKFAISVL